MTAIRSHAAAGSLHSPTIQLIDDDEAVRDSLAPLIGTVGLRVMTWDDPQAFLAHFDRDGIGAIVLDVRMPGISGLTVLNTLVAQGVDQCVHADRSRDGGHVPPRLHGRRRRVPGKAGRRRVAD
jgi:CheY-like chemotaxis protein